MNNTIRTGTRTAKKRREIRSQMAERFCFVSYSPSSSYLIEGQYINTLPAAHKVHYTHTVPQRMRKLISIFILLLWSDLVFSKEHWFQEIEIWIKTSKILNFMLIIYLFMFYFWRVLLTLKMVLISLPSFRKFLECRDQMRIIIKWKKCYMCAEVGKIFSYFEFAELFVLEFIFTFSSGDYLYFIHLV